MYGRKRRVKSGNVDAGESNREEEKWPNVRTEEKGRDGRCGGREDESER